MTSKGQSALVILSGGQDSTICSFWARERYETIHAISFDYGQTHAVELRSAEDIARASGMRSHEIVRLGPGVLKGRSPLINRTEALETYTDFQSMDAIIGDRVELTFVPMRNLLFLTLAANRAVLLGCEAMVTGICQADNANYADCRQDFADATAVAINRAIGREIGDADALRIEAPLMNLSKAESIRLGQSLPGCLDALAFSHTCYAGQVPPCGVCHACVLRAHGFAEAGIADPLLVRMAA